MAETYYPIANDYTNHLPARLTPVELAANCCRCRGPRERLDKALVPITEQLAALEHVLELAERFLDYAEYMYPAADRDKLRGAIEAAKATGASQ